MGEDRELDEIFERERKKERINNLFVLIVGVPLVIVVMIWTMYVAFFAPSEFPDEVSTYNEDPPDPEDIYGSY